jgi:hypothetical protein
LNWSSREISVVAVSASATTGAVSTTGSGAATTTGSGAGAGAGAAALVDLVTFFAEVVLALRGVVDLDLAGIIVIGNKNNQ